MARQARHAFYQVHAVVSVCSATADLRFHPVGPQEVPLLKCHVSLLGSFEPAGRWDDWIVGVHGTIISFTDPGTPCRMCYVDQMCPLCSVHSYMLISDRFTKLPQVRECTVSSDNVWVRALALSFLTLKL